MSVIGVCALLVEAEEEAVARTVEVVAAIAEMAAQAVMTDLPPRTEIAVGMVEITTAQVISTRATTVAEGEGTTQGQVECHSQVVAVIVGQAEGSRTSRDHHRARLIKVPHHLCQELDQDHSP